MAGPDDEEEVLRVGGEGEVAFDHDLSVMLRGLPEFADRGIGDPVGQHDVLADELDGLELAERGRERAAADFRGRRGGGARVGLVHRGAELPARDNRVPEPEFAFRLRRGELTTQRLAARVEVGAGSKGLVAHSLAAPDGGDAQQVGIKAGPAVVG